MENGRWKTRGKDSVKTSKKKRKEVKGGGRETDPGTQARHLLVWGDLYTQNVKYDTGKKEKSGKDLGRSQGGRRRYLRRLKDWGSGKRSDLTVGTSAEIESFAQGQRENARSFSQVS